MMRESTVSTYEKYLVLERHLVPSLEMMYILLGATTSEKKMETKIGNIRFERMIEWIDCGFIL
jgi:hypothetical protein